MIFNVKVYEWLLLITVLLSPFYFHGNLGSTGLLLPNNIFIWFSASLVIALSIYQLSKAEVLVLPRIYFFCLLFPFAAWFSSIFSGVELFNQWFFRMLFLFGGLLFFFSLFQQGFKQKQWDKLLFLMLIAGFFHSLMGLMQILFESTIPTWLPKNPSGNPTGFFQQINNQASFQVTILIIAFWLNTRPMLSQNRHPYFIFSLLVIALSSFILAYSGSRVGILGFVLATPLFLFSRWKWVKQNAKKWLLIITILISSVYAATLYNEDKGLSAVAEKTTAINSGYSGASRLGIYTISWQLIQEKPLWGHGIGSFVRVWQNAKPSFYKDHPDATLPNQRVSHPHNETIFWLVEGGVIVGGVLCIFAVAVLLSLLKLPASRRYVFIALLLPISIHTQVELPFYISALHWFLFLTLLAMTLSPTQKTITLSLSGAARSSLKITSIVMLLLSSVFFIHSYQSSVEIKQFISKTDKHESPLDTALQNPYFKNVATDLLMFSMFNQSINKGISSNIELFKEWAESTIAFNPHPNHFLVAINSNRYLNNKTKACELAKKANEIYPDNKSFISVLKSCKP